MGVTIPGLSAPVRLQDHHLLEPFNCGTTSLNEWLKTRALKNQASDSARTFVVCIDTIVIGYYCLATGGIARSDAPKSMQRNVADPIPVIVLGRFAVDINYQGQGVGSALLKHAIQMVIQVSEIVGIKAILVHAIDDRAKDFYLAHSFVVSPVHLLTLCLPLSTARQAMVASGTPRR